MIDSSLLFTELSFVSIVSLFSVFGGNISKKVEGSNKPKFYPQGWVFGLVWSILFLIFGIFLYKLDNTKDRIIGLIYFTLILAWTPIFVNTNYFFGFLYILFTLILTILFQHIYNSSILIPQQIWISFATVLAGSLYALN